MSRGWWARIRRESHGNGPVSAPEPIREPLAPEPPPRLTAPRGVLTWICVTPAGGKSDHPSEQAAKNRAAMTKGAVVYPAVVEIEESAS